MNARWTEDTEEVVALAIHVADCEDSWEECRTWKAHGRAVREVLTKLANAGLLVQPGGDTLTEWCVITRDGRGEPVVWSNCANQEAAEADYVTAKHEGWPGVSKQTRSITTWADGSQLFGPWVEPTTGSTE